VWFVTGRAPVFLDDGMQGSPVGRIVVALCAQGRTGGNKKFRVFRGVRIVTVYAATVCGSFVSNRFRSGIIVATDTQISDRLKEKSPVFRSMRVVAPQAPLLFHCRMDTRTFRWFIVALITEGAALFHQCQFVVIPMIIVTRFAIRLLERRMNYLLPGGFL
jgi:hypothetical protein